MTDHQNSSAESKSAKDFYDMSGPDLLDYCGADASKWAEAFCKIKEAQGWGASDIDEGLMITWFANAIEHSAMVRRTPDVAQGAPTLEQIDAACQKMVAGWAAMDDRDRYGWRSEAKQWAYALGLYAAQPPAAPVETDADLPTAEDVRGILGPPPERSSAATGDADAYEKRIREKVWASECLSAGEWVYLVGLFHTAREAEERLRDEPQAVATPAFDALAAEVIDRISERYNKLAASPLGMATAWERKASGGKPLLYGGRRGLLASGTIATWDEFDLIADVINNLPTLLAACSVSRPQCGPSASSPADSAPSQRLPE